MRMIDAMGDSVMGAPTLAGGGSEAGSEISVAACSTTSIAPRYTCVTQRVQGGAMRSKYWATLRCLGCRWKRVGVHGQASLLNPSHNKS